MTDDADGHPHGGVVPRLEPLAEQLVAGLADVDLDLGVLGVEALDFFLG